jgi:hypothetical protein
MIDFLSNAKRLTCFSRTHILTSDSNSAGLEAMFSAAILARAVPHDPEPTIATLCFPDGSGEAGNGEANGDGGRVAAEEGGNVSTIARFAILQPVNSTAAAETHQAW